MYDWENRYLCRPWNHYEPDYIVVGGSTTRQGKWGASRGGDDEYDDDSVKDNNNETETNFNQSGVRENTDHRGERILENNSSLASTHTQQPACLYYRWVWIDTAIMGFCGCWSSSLNSRKTRSTVHRNPVKIRIINTRTTI